MLKKLFKDTIIYGIATVLPSCAYPIAHKVVRE